MRIQQLSGSLWSSGQQARVLPCSSRVKLSARTQPLLGQNSLQTAQTLSPVQRQSCCAAPAAADVETVDARAVEPRQGRDSADSRPSAEARRPRHSQNGSNEASTSGHGHHTEQKGLSKPSFQKSNSKNSRQKHFRPQDSDKKRGRVEDFTHRRGDIIVGKVIGGATGWRVALEEDKDILGFVSTHDLPHILRDTSLNPVWNQTKYGLLREFEVRAVPEEMEYNGKGPLLSARTVDLDVIWKRAAQIMQICKEEHECIRVQMYKKNNGGLLGAFEGLAVFIPYSFIPKAPGHEHVGKEELAESYIGKETLVSICDIDRKSNRFVGNIVKGLQDKCFNKLKVGDLVWGTVQGVEKFGVFVTLDDFPTIRGLLHVASISRNHVDDPKSLFHSGERLRCIIIGLDSKSYRIQLSTAEIEGEGGDMLYNKARVYENAEANAADFRNWVEGRQHEIEAGDVEYDGDGENGNQGLDW